MVCASTWWQMSHAGLSRCWRHQWVPDGMWWKFWFVPFRPEVLAKMDGSFWPPLVSTATGIQLKPVGEKDINRCYKFVRPGSHRPFSKWQIQWPKKTKGSLFIRVIGLIQQIFIERLLSARHNRDRQGLLFRVRWGSKAPITWEGVDLTYALWPDGKEEPGSWGQALPQASMLPTTWVCGF